MTDTGKKAFTEFKHSWAEVLQYINTNLKEMKKLAT